MAEVSARRRGQAALALRLAGAGYDEVADALGLDSARDARAQVEEALAARAYEDQDGRNRLRTEAGARIDRLLRSVWTKATDTDSPEHLMAVRVARELIDRHIKLFGLDAPQEVIIHNPTAQEIESWVATVISQDAPGVIEASVVDDSESAA